MPEALVETGRQLALGPDSRHLPSCRACHGPWPAPRAPALPDLAGQHADYILAQLRLWKLGRRGGTPLANLMHVVADELEDDQMRALAAFYAAGAPTE
jgi:cytochrome c oxidase subunit 1